MYHLAWTLISLRKCFRNGHQLGFARLLMTQAQTNDPSRNISLVHFSELLDIYYISRVNKVVVIYYV